MGGELQIIPLESTLTKSTTSTIPSKTELVDIYLLNFELPSNALAIMSIDYEVEKDKRILIEIRKIEQEIKRKIDALRNDFYFHCNKIFHTSKLGWIAVTPHAIPFANEWNEKVSNILKNIANEIILKKMSQIQDEDLKKLYEKLYHKLLSRANRKNVEAIRIWLEPDVAKEVLKDVLNRINEEIQVLKEKIKKAEEEKNKKAVYRANAELLTLEFKYKLFEQKLKEIE